MYNYNNKDRSKEEGLNDWYLTLTSDRDRTHTHRESRVTQTLTRIWNVLKPKTSTKGTSRYHR